MRLCNCCFEEIKNELEVCPFCGYVDGACSDVENSITIGSILSERYQIGKVIESDNSSITYLAWDKNSDMKVSIKEFFPKNLVNRKSNSLEVAVKEGKKQLFDNGFNEFVAEAKRMYAGNSSVKLYDCIAVNNTAYMILEAPNPTDEFNPFKSVKNDDIDSNSSIDSSNDINVIRTGDKERDLKQLINSIPLWAKIAVPVLIGVVIVISILSKVGLFTSNNDADEMVFETAVTETTVESTNTVVDADVMILDGRSYACCSGYETWEDARDYCESLGGHLAVISSQRENDALYTFSLVCGYDNVYIGYSDAGHEGDWQWVNGEESAYTNWNSGEPNGFTQLENYAVMSTDGKWFDADYAPRYEGGMVSFICEWDYEVIGLNYIDYEDLPPIESLVSVEETETVIDTSSDVPVLTDELATQAFENFFETYEPMSLTWSYSKIGCDDEYCVYMVDSYAGGSSDNYDYFYMDLNTGLTRDVMYLDSTLHEGAAFRGIDLELIGLDLFNAWDYIPEYGVVPPDQNSCTINGDEQYFLVMSCIDDYESRNPSSVYAIHHEYYSYTDAGCWIVYMQSSNGQNDSYIVDNYGLLHTEYPLANDEYVSYESIRSYPLLTDVPHEEPWNSVSPMNYTVNGCVPDGSYSGYIVGFNEDCSTAIVELYDYYAMSDAEINSLQIGDTLNVGSMTLQVIGFDDYSGDPVFDDEWWFSEIIDGRNVLTTSSDYAALIDGGVYDLPIDTNAAIGTYSYWGEDLNDAEFNNYIAQRGYTGNPIQDSPYWYYSVSADEDLGLIEHTNGYFNARGNCWIVIANNKIIEMDINIPNEDYGY